MKKQLSIFIIFSFMLFLNPNFLKATNNPRETLEKTLIQLLQEPILKVIGTDWFRGSEKVLEIKNDDERKGILYVRVQAVTYEGPHNPPYTEEIITFKIIGNKVRPIDYYNRVIPEKELYKFKLQLILF